MKKKNPAQTAVQIILGLILVFFIISFSVVFTLNFRPLYYFDIGHLNISEMSGYTDEDIKANYDELIDYNFIFGPDTLDFPTLTMSESGRIHFEEVKDIFVAVQIICVVTLILGIAGIIWQHRKKDIRCLKYASILTIAIPVVLGLIFSLDWEKSFVTFHHIFFNNDYWIFDPSTDPVISILPDAFFFHCAMMILGTAILGSVICFIIYHFRTKKLRIQ